MGGRRKTPRHDAGGPIVPVDTYTSRDQAGEDRYAGRIASDHPESPMVALAPFAPQKIYLKMRQGT